MSFWLTLRYSSNVALHGGQIQGIRALWNAGPKLWKRANAQDLVEDGGVSAPELLFASLFIVFHRPVL